MHVCASQLHIYVWAQRSICDTVKLWRRAVHVHSVHIHGTGRCRGRAVWMA